MRKGKRTNQKSFGSEVRVRRSQEVTPTMFNKGTTQLDIMMSEVLECQLEEQEKGTNKAWLLVSPTHSNAFHGLNFRTEPKLCQLS